MIAFRTPDKAMFGYARFGGNKDERILHRPPSVGIVEKELSKEAQRKKGKRAPQTRLFV